MHYLEFVGGVVGVVSELRSYHVAFQKQVDRAMPCMRCCTAAIAWLRKRSEEGRRSQSEIVARSCGGDAQNQQAGV